MTVSFKNNNIILSELHDFDLGQTLDCGQCFRWSQNPDGSYTGVVKDKICTIRQVNTDFIIENMSQDDYNNIWHDYFDLDTDYETIKNTLIKHPVLNKASEFAPGIRVLKQENWETLCSFIISQNNNIKRIKGIVKKLCENYGEDLGDGYFTFPKACKLAKLNVEDLQDLKSGFRARYIIDAAQKVANGDVNLDALKTMPLEEARKELMKIVGVGAKVADCTLLYGCGRLDCFPMDVWIKRAMKYLLPEGLPEYTLAYAGIVQQYIFHYVRMCPGALPIDEDEKYSDLK